MCNMYKLAEDINFKVNNEVTYCSDIKQYNIPEFWIEAGKFGDCEDYALLKRNLLLKANWPKDKLFLTCCWDETNSYHCVLMVDTDKGVFILDNRYPWPTMPTQLPYTWDKCEKEGLWCELSF